MFSEILRGVRLLSVDRFHVFRYDVEERLYIHWEMI